MRTLATAALCCLLLICLQDGPAHACTSFCLDTPDGSFFATNFDFITGEGLVFVNQRGIAKEGYRQSTTGETAKWTSAYGSVTFNVVGREFAWSGMNEAGLVISSMELRASTLPPPDERTPFGMADWVQYVLDTCGSVQEVIALGPLVRVQDVGYPNHYLITDKDGQCAAIEYLDGEFVCYTGDELPVKAMANAVYAGGPAYIEQGVFPALNPGASVERVAACKDKIERFGAEPGTSPVEYAMRVLTETVVAPKKWWSNLFGESYTRWNIVYDIAHREVHFRTVESPRIKHLALGAFDLSCNAPLLMLDVNTDLEGNVEQAFKPYDHDVNLKIFRTLCDKMDIEVSKEDAVELMAFFESFECVR